MEQFFTAYILTLVILVPGAVVAFFAINAPASGLGPKDIPQMLLGLGLFLGLWHAAATLVATSGAMGTALVPYAPPTVGLFFIGGGLLLFALGLSLSSFRRVIDHMGQRYFMGFQGFRVLGFVFLIGAITGDIPLIFAIPAGLGDIWAGIMGIRAARAVAAKAPDAARKVRQANTVGLLDFAVALGTGLITSETAYQLVAHDAPNAVGFYPLVMIPAMLVPLFFAAHLFSIRALKRSANQALPTLA